MTQPTEREARLAEIRAAKPSDDRAVWQERQFLLEELGRVERERDALADAIESNAPIVDVSGDLIAHAMGLGLEEQARLTQQRDSAYARGLEDGRKAGDATFNRELASVRVELDEVREDLVNMMKQRNDALSQLKPMTEEEAGELWSELEAQLPEHVQELRRERDLAESEQKRWHEAFAAETLARSEDIDRLTKQLEDRDFLLEQSARCSFCGERCLHEDAAGHMEACPKHPLSAALERIAVLEKAAHWLVDEYVSGPDHHREDCPEFGSGGCEDCQEVARIDAVLEGRST